MIDDQSSITKLRTGGDQALAEVLARHGTRLLQIVRLRIDPRVLRRIDPADVLQEAFLQASKRLPRYLATPAVPVFVWLRSVVLDTLADFHRRHLDAQMRDASLEIGRFVPLSPQASSMALGVYLATNRSSPSQAVIREETSRQIEAALNDMDAIDREVLILRHFEHLTNNEVAAALGVKKAAATRRYMRALARFRVLLLGLPGFEP